MSKSTFGPTLSDIESLTGTEASDWFKAELNKPRTEYLQPVLDFTATLPPGEDAPIRIVSDFFFNAAIAGDDQLRQRMVLALSEIIVVSTDGQLNSAPAAVGYYIDILSENAFGNYRDLLGEITYSPAMAVYLTYLANVKGDANTGRIPDENYAREILQLFTIGLNELNADGTEKLDAGGQPIETFDNSDITGLARVFTGLSLDGPNFFLIFDDPTSFYRPLKTFDDFHSDLEKSFLGQTITANTSTAQSIDRALDTIFEHPNVAPFVSRQLIQRFVTSDPAPAYVARVSSAFETGRYTLPDGSAVGTAIRGDLTATLAAVLFDENALRAPGIVPAEFGKIREPITRFTHWARAFNELDPDASDERFLSEPFSAMGQFPFRSPSVFNFFRPGYVAPNSETGAAGLTAPELQILNESTSIGYINIMNAFIYNFAPNVSGNDQAGVSPDYSFELSIADDVPALIDHLDLLLTGNRLTTEERERTAQMMAEVPLTATNDNEARYTRVALAITMVMTSPNYLVQR